MSQIRIYKAAASGDELGPVNVWVPGTGPTVDGSQLSFSRSSYGWDACTRSNSTTNPDSIGVSISYTYHAVTPLASLLRFFRRSRVVCPPRQRQVGHGPQPHRLRDA